jgi:ketosteroid isomerase-like protein
MRVRSLSSAFLLLTASACVHVTVQHARTSSEGEIRARLDSTALGWNRGDLATYLAAYTPDATEMLADGVAHGRDRIEQTMKQGFWKSGRPLQQLHYEHVEVRMLGDDHDGWRMIHDHS